MARKIDSLLPRKPLPPSFKLHEGALSNTHGYVKTVLIGYALVPPSSKVRCPPWYQCRLLKTCHYLLAEDCRTRQISNTVIYFRTFRPIAIGHRTPSALLEALFPLPSPRHNSIYEPASRALNVVIGSRIGTKPLKTVRNVKNTASPKGITASANLVCVLKKTDLEHESRCSALQLIPLEISRHQLSCLEGDRKRGRAVKGLGYGDSALQTRHYRHTSTIPRAECY